MAKPLVSIGMPVYNEGQFIRQALESLLAQDYENFELIISDNASEDKTPEICLEYAARDKRIRYYRNEKNMGAAWNFKRVFDLSKGKYFMWSAGHDLWNKKFISKCLEVLENDPSVVLCYPQTMLIDMQGRELKILSSCLDTRSEFKASRRFHRTIWELNWCESIYGLIRPDALKKTSLGVALVGVDCLLLAELSLLGKFVLIPETLFYLRLNRPEETEEQVLRRYFDTLAPNMNTVIPYTLLMLHHLIAVKNAQISLKEKLELVPDVLVRFVMRYQVHEEILGAIHPNLKPYAKNLRPYVKNILRKAEKIRRFLRDNLIHRT